MATTTAEAAIREQLSHQRRARWPTLNAPGTLHAGSKEIVHNRLPGVRFAASGCRVELHECVVHGLVDLHDRGLVATTVAIVWGGEDRHHLPVMTPIVTFHDQLMRPRDECEAIRCIEFFGDVLSEGVPSAARADTPSKPVFRVAPE